MWLLRKRRPVLLPAVGGGPRGELLLEPMIVIGGASNRPPRAVLRVWLAVHRGIPPIPPELLGGWGGRPGKGGVGGVNPPDGGRQTHGARRRSERRRGRSRVKGKRAAPPLRASLGLVWQDVP